MVTASDCKLHFLSSGKPKIWHKGPDLWQPTYLYVILGISIARPPHGPFNKIQSVDPEIKETRRLKFNSEKTAIDLYLEF